MARPPPVKEKCLFSPKKRPPDSSPQSPQFVTPGAPPVGTRPRPGLRCAHPATHPAVFARTMPDASRPTDNQPRNTRTTRTPTSNLTLETCRPPAPRLPNYQSCHPGLRSGTQIPNRRRPPPPRPPAATKTKLSPSPALSVVERDAKNAKKTSPECPYPLRSWRLCARHNSCGFSRLRGSRPRNSREKQAGN
jgi:hypothetical protein